MVKICKILPYKPVQKCLQLQAFYLFIFPWLMQQTIGFPPDKHCDVRFVTQEMTSDNQ